VLTESLPENYTTKRGRKECSRIRSGPVKNGKPNWMPCSVTTKRRSRIILKRGDRSN
jgi:hypothetical protein